MNKEIRSIASTAEAEKSHIFPAGPSSPPSQVVITIWAYWIGSHIARKTKNSREILGGNASRGIMGEALHSLIVRQEKLTRRSAAEKRLLTVLQAAWRRHGGVTSAAREPNKATIQRLLADRREQLRLNYRITRNLIRLHRYNPEFASVANAKLLLKESKDGSGDAMAGNAKVKEAWASHKYAAHFIYACFHHGVSPCQLLDPRKKIDDKPIPIERIISTSIAVRAELRDVKAKRAKPGSIFSANALLHPERAFFVKAVPMPRSNVGEALRPDEPQLTEGEKGRLQKDVGSAGRNTGRRRKATS